jgi:ribosomal protein S12
MISVEEMKKAVNKEVNIELTNGKVVKGYCTEYLWPEDEDEEHNITVKENGVLLEINQSEIEGVEILS